MGSMITLGIGKMEIDWGKNNFFIDHSALFQKEDLKLVPYYYADDVKVMKKGYSKKLKLVKKRLDLLGYSLSGIKEKFNKELGYLMKLYNRSYDFSFENFYESIINIDVQNVDMNTDEYFYEYDLGEYVRSRVLTEIELFNQPDNESDYELEEFLENLSPYITLRILSENKKNEELEVIWRPADVIENGWVIREDISKSLPEDKKIIIVTEGSTDTFIIRKTIESLYPAIVDFFEFIDMENNYPFTGTGNLGNFVKGLAKINIQNNILVILDNDTAGLATFEEIANIEKPENLHVITLPNHPDLKNFNCKGPEGYTKDDINGKAVAIEAFLDFNSITDDVYVRWSNYNRKMDQYHGYIEPKRKLIKAFEKATRTNYNTDKLKYLIDYCLDSWINR